MKPRTTNGIPGPHLTPELEAYYADRGLMVRNVILIGLSNIGWGVMNVLIVPLVAMRLLKFGVRENVQGSISSVNSWMLSFLVMYFSWKSDHTVSRLGRRKPFLFLSAPFIIATTFLFPVFNEARWVWLLVALSIVKLLFTDIKASTFPLLAIDCVPRPILARANSVFDIVGGLVGFTLMQTAGSIIAVGEWFPFVLAGTVVTIATLSAFWIKEPPIRHPATEKFKLWSTFKVAATDKRIFWLMAGVAMINAYLIMNTQWLWFWSKETLHLERGDIFQALSWAGLVNVVLAWPIGWVIDRWGGFRVVLMLWFGQLLCFLWAMQVHDKAGLVILSLAVTMTAPLYAGADIMVYKSAPPAEVGSITSTNSFIRNMFRSLLVFTSGWAIYWVGHNYKVGFVMGMVMSTVGLALFWIYRKIMALPTPSEKARPSHGG